MIAEMESHLSPLAVTEPIVRNYRLDLILPGKNAREEFAEDELQELGDSMKETRGPLQPLVGIPQPDGTIVLIAGERRLRAAQKVGIESLPVCHREPPTPREELKWGLIENLQRVNLKPMEEAKAVAAMLELTDEAGKRFYTVRGLADELGKNPRYVANCVALMSAPKRTQKAVNDGVCVLEVGVLIGQLPASMHERAEAEIVFRPAPLGPMNRDDARAHIKEHLRRDLRNASFDQEDGSLVKDAPACQACQYWGGNRDDVEGRTKDSTCLNPACFDAKQSAHAKLIRVHAEEQGTRVLTPTEAEAVFQSWDNEVSPTSGFVELKRVPDAWMLKPGAKAVPEWEKILVDSGVKLVVAVDANGASRRLVEAKTALQAAKQSEEYGASFKDSTALKTQAEKKEEAAIKKAGDTAAERELIAGCMALHEALSEPFTGDKLLEVGRQVFHMVRTRCIKPDDAELLCRMLQPDLGRISSPVDELEKLVLRETQFHRLFGLISMALIARSIRFESAFPTAAETQEAGLLGLVEFNSAAANEKIKKARGEAEKAVKDEQKRAAKRAEKKATKKGAAAPEGVVVHDATPGPDANLTEERGRLMALLEARGEALGEAPGPEGEELPIEEHPKFTRIKEEFGGEENPDTGRVEFPDTLGGEAAAALEPPMPEEPLKRECAHCLTVIEHKEEAEFFAHVKACSKKTSLPLRRGSGGNPPAKKAPFKKDVKATKAAKKTAKAKKK